MDWIVLKTFGICTLYHRIVREYNVAYNMRYNCTSIRAFNGLETLWKSDTPEICKDGSTKEQCNDLNISSDDS